MVIVTRLPEQHIIFVTLRPNSSLSWGGNVALVGSLTLLAILIGGSFAMLGAWVILPFSGLEILLLFSCLYTFARHNASQEVITFSDDKVRIERGTREPAQEWIFPRVWSSFHVEKPESNWATPVISIRNQGNILELGSFLNRRDKIKLVNTLKRIVNDREPASVSDSTR